MSVSYGYHGTYTDTSTKYIELVILIKKQLNKCIVKVKCIKTLQRRDHPEPIRWNSGGIIDTHRLIFVSCQLFMIILTWASIWILNHQTSCVFNFISPFFFSNKCEIYNSKLSIARLPEWIIFLARKPVHST